jgi:hypothetical protein
VLLFSAGTGADATNGDLASGGGRPTPRRGMKPRLGLSAGRQRNAATRGKEEAGQKRQGTAGDGGTALQNPAGLGTGTCQGADYIVKKKIKEKVRNCCVISLESGQVYTYKTVIASSSSI